MIERLEDAPSRARPKAHLPQTTIYWLSSLLTLAALTGCSHRVALAGTSQVADAKLGSIFQEPKKVAFMLTGLPSSQEASGGGHSYHLDNLRPQFEQIARSALRTSGLRVEFFGDRPPPPDADWLVFPTMTLKIRGVFSHTCAAAYILVVKDGAGRVLATGEATST